MLEIWKSGVGGYVIDPSLYKEGESVTGGATKHRWWKGWNRGVFGPISTAETAARYSCATQWAWKGLYASISIIRKALIL